MSEATETVTFQKSDVTIFSIGGYPPSNIRASPPPTLILVGPGNPGLVVAYKKFVRSLHKKLQLPVWVHSFVGHGTTEPFHGVEPQHRLPSQIAMTKHLFRNYLRDVRIICIDHSTSCYIILQLLREPDIGPQIAEAYFLMPVISKPDTRKGSILCWIVNSRFFLAYIETYSWIHSKMPLSWRDWCDAAYYRGAGYKNVPHFPLTFPGILRKAFTLGSDLFEIKLDLEPLIQFADRLHIFCSDMDDLLGSWVHELKSKVPSIDMKQNTRIPHVFYIDESETTAEIFAEWISETVKHKKHNLSKYLET